MAGKKVKSEIETMRSELRSLSEAVWALRDQVTFEAATAAATNGSGGKHHDDIAADLQADDDGRGLVVTRGVVRNAAGSREYRWDHETSVEAALEVDEVEAAQLLAAIGHRQRLAILKAIFNSPSTAADLVNTLDLGTTGAAYHHLNVLQASGLVVQETRGVFEIRPDRVSSFLAILSGIGSTATSAETPVPAVEQATAEEPAKSPGRKHKSS
jgi:DNA gyrase subunit B